MYIFISNHSQLADILHEASSLQSRASLAQMHPQNSLISKDIEETHDLKPLLQCIYVQIYHMFAKMSTSRAGAGGFLL